MSGNRVTVDLKREPTPLVRTGLLWSANFVEPAVYGDLRLAMERVAAEYLEYQFGWDRNTDPDVTVRWDLRDPNTWVLFVNDKSTGVWLGQLPLYNPK